jgi:MGT family glycosyltransferase
VARILFTVPPLTGHLNPALAVAESLTRQGHQVAWAVHAVEIGALLPEDAHVYPLNEKAVPDFPAALTRVRGFESVRVFVEEYAVPMTERAFALLEAAVRQFVPDVMVVDQQMLAGALVARKLGIRWVTLVTTSASILRSTPAVHAWLDAQYLALQQRFLPPERIVQQPDLSHDGVIVFSVETLVGTAQTRIEAAYTFVGPARGEKRRHVAFPWEWLRADSRKILVTLGTRSRDRDNRFFEVIMEAVAPLSDLQAVLVAPASLAAQAPENVLVREYVPQTELLDRIDAVICHAGHNTVCEALCRELPLIVAPIRDDQPVVARQVIETGAGLFMRYGKVTAASARALIEQLLADAELRVNARRVARDLLAAPGADGAARIIAGLAAVPARPTHFAA